jgi:hypothetical protein
MADRKSPDLESFYARSLGISTPRMFTGVIFEGDHRVVIAFLECASSVDFGESCGEALVPFLHAGSPLLVSFAAGDGGEAEGGHFPAPLSAEVEEGAEDDDDEGRILLGDFAGEVEVVKVLPVPVAMARIPFPPALLQLAIALRWYSRRTNPGGGPKTAGTGSSRKKSSGIPGGGCSGSRKASRSPRPA